MNINRNNLPKILTEHIISHQGYILPLQKIIGGFVLREKNGTQNIFDTAGKLTSIADCNDNTITFAYTGGNLTAVTDPTGSEFALAYNANNKIESITAPGDNNTWTYIYDSLVSGLHS